MAAGLGFKTFANGEVLSAADVNGYLMQGVLVFANAAERSAEITSPQEGQFSYLKDSNSTWYYSGSAWVASGGSPLTTKGDVYTYSTTDARLAVGANDTVLTADSSTATGLKWATSAAGGMTSIASGTLSGASVSITSIPSTYVNLVLYVNNPYLSSDAGRLGIRINNSSTAQYGRWYMQSNGSNGGDGSSNDRWQISDGTASNLSTGTTNYTSASVTFWNYADTTSQKSMSFQIQDRNATFNSLGGTGGTYVSNTAAISSIQIIAGGYSFAGGTYTLYGVK
jgi:hypothetical protein